MSCLSETMNVRPVVDVGDVDVPWIFVEVFCADVVVIGAGVVVVVCVVVVVLLGACVVV